MREAFDSPDTESAILLGRIHWHLIKADKTLWTKAVRGVPIPSQHGSQFQFTRTERTPFGNEVGNDEIRWWVCRKEANTQELSFETQKLIPLIQHVIDRIKEWNYTAFTSYNSVVASLESLTDTFRNEIDALWNYVGFLIKRDELAPSILLARKVWHSSPLSDRLVQIKASDYDLEAIETRQNIIECVYGLRFAGRTYNFSLEVARMAIEEDREETNHAVLITAKEAQDEMLLYFRSLRTCLENVLVEIQHIDESEDIAHSEDFWREFIKASARSNKVEPELWDFKETLDYWRVATQETENAKFKFATDVASFANSYGGVLIVGVTDGPNREIKGVTYSGKDLENKIKTISQVLISYLNHDKISYHVCQVTIEHRICIVIVIAQAKHVICVRKQSNLYMYPSRRMCESIPSDPNELLERKKNILRDNYQFIQRLASLGKK